MRDRDGNLRLHGRICCLLELCRKQQREICEREVDDNPHILSGARRRKVAMIRYLHTDYLRSMSQARFVVLRRNEILRPGLRAPDPEFRSSRGSFPDLLLSRFPVDEFRFAFVD